jgi:hypothetical protein
MPARCPKRKRSSVSERNITPPPKTVKIAPFNRATSGSISSVPSDDVQPEIASVAGGGQSIVCHAVPLPGKRVPLMKTLPGSEMVTFGNADAFVACIPVSCEGAFSLSALAEPKRQCSCKAHVTALSLKVNVQGFSKKDPLVIDSDDDEVTIVEEVRPPLATEPSPEGNELMTCILYIFF